jgi:hypothetical protein
MKQDAIKIFEDETIRTVWDDEEEKWYVSIVDVPPLLVLSPTNRHASTT